MGLYLISIHSTFGEMTKIEYTVIFLPPVACFPVNPESWLRKNCSSTKTHSENLCFHDFSRSEVCFFAMWSFKVFFMSYQVISWSFQVISRSFKVFFMSFQVTFKVLFRSFQVIVKVLQGQV